MANWKRSNNDPVTTEKRVAVFNTDNPEITGMVDVRWVAGSVRFNDPVYSVEYQYEGDHCTGEKTTVLDNDPTFN